MIAAGRSNRRRGASRPLLAAAFGLALVVTPVAAHADFAQGVRAYEAGDHKAALDAWLPLAERGDVAAMRNVGHLYRWGQGVEKDVPQAMQWYRKAAETGFARAQANLAAIYLQGDEGVPIDYPEARKWFEAAAKQGHAVAQYNLGLMYELGLGVEKNDAVALGWYNNAAKAGQPDALERLSLLVMRRDDAAKASAATAPAQTPADAPRAVSADERTENAGSSPPPAAAALAAPTPPPAAQAAPAPESAPVPALASPTEMPPAMFVPSAVATTPAAAPAATTAADDKSQETGFPWLFGRIFSAISSGGGVSIPDIFEDSPATPETQPVEPENGRKAAEPVSRP
jgi:TPR repeat protein